MDEPSPSERQPVALQALTLLWVVFFSPWLRPGHAPFRQRWLNVSALLSNSPELDFSVI